MKKFSTYHICMIALAIVINMVGAQIALVCRLPIYLDSIGTVLIAAVCGPIYGMIPSVLSGFIFGMTSDIYSLYYAPVGILLGLLVGLIFKKQVDKPWWIFLATLIVTVPTALISSLITAYLFGGITSSGSAMIVQILAKTPLGLTLSCFIVQVCTEYVDRLVAMFIVVMALKKFPDRLVQKLKEA